MYEMTTDQPTEPTLAITEGTRSKEETVSFTLPEDTPPVSFGLAGEISPSRGSVSQRVLTLPGGKDVVLTAVVLYAQSSEGSFKGRWESPKPTEPLPQSRGYGGHGAIDGLPASLREAALALLSLPAKPKRSFPSFPLEGIGTLVIGTESYSAPAIEKRPGGDTVDFVVFSGKTGAELKVLKSVPGLGDEYLMPVGEQAERIEGVMLSLGLLEPSGYAWRGQRALVSRGEFQKFTGVGFGPADRRQP